MAKKLTNYLLDLGRTVAYYPNLKKVTESTTATIFLCQLLYWTDKGRDADGWIYKDSIEIEEETGLTYNEQKTARDKLSKLQLIDEIPQRLNHNIKFRVNQDILNQRWEELHGEYSVKKEDKVKKDKVKEKEVIDGEQLELPIETPIEEPEQPEEKIEEIPARHSDMKKRGDIIDGYMDFNKNSPGAIKERKIQDIHQVIRMNLHINTDSARWNKFVEFAYNRQEKHGEPFSVFLDWLLKQPNFDPMFWSPERMKTYHPQAYIVNQEVDTFYDDMVDPTLKYKEEEFVPLPKNIGKK
jgi:hypothetical protein